jgi:pimeloyl-ACP methyl ester carboxylesterase
MAAVGDANRSEAEWAELRARHPQGDEQIRALSRIARGFAATFDDMAFTPPLLATIRARTLIVTGDRDPLYPLEIFVEQFRAIPGAALMVIPNGGHDAVFREARPDFVRSALAFLGGGR